MSAGVKLCEGCTSAGCVSVTVSDKDREYYCYDCSHYPPSYMVLDEVWERAVPDYREQRKSRRFNLCFSCLESRLGRELTVRDFQEVPVNQGIFFGYLMGVR